MLTSDLILEGVMQDEDVCKEKAWLATQAFLIS